jgi:hypothetical protein
MCISTIHAFLEAGVYFGFDSFPIKYCHVTIQGVSEVRGIISHACCVHRNYGINCVNMDPWSFRFRAVANKICLRSARIFICGTILKSSVHGS